ncbi:MAG TPA: cytochrome c oxidase subunit 3 [Terriglobales bacterium]|nr:cytochrome c oxidase subunit 3 [Terriglobales bacterium]HXY13079.1 cytochrome c oxidase subunit 3 [Terriglobales bacterium]
MSQSAIAAVTHHEVVMEASPYAMDKKKLGMWVFIVSDACSFAAFLFAYGYMRVGAPVWGTPFGFSSILNGVVMTAVLLSSSLTMLAATHASQTGEKASAGKWLGITMLLGTIFAALHLREWFKLIAEGWRLFYNPAGGAAQFGAAFFSVTGLHLTHVVTGVIVLAFIARGYRQGRYDETHVETAGLYWHFVDLVWMFVFPLMYLMNAH